MFTSKSVAEGTKSLRDAAREQTPLEDIRRQRSSHSLIIGIIGEKGSGKDTVADYIVEKYQFIKDSFAANLKASVKEMFNLSDEQLNDPSLKEVPDPRWNNCTPRQLLQFVGTELLRNQIGQIMPNIASNIHVHALEMRLSGKKIVLSDVRFLNEAEMISRNGGILVKIVRKSSVYSTNDAHASEVEQRQIKYDYLIENNGSLGELYASVDEIFDTNIPETSRRVIPIKSENKK